MIALEIIGADRVITRLGESPDKIRAAAKSSLDIWATELAGYIKTDKLSGQVLNRISGRLSSSVHPVSEQSSNAVSGGAGGGAGVDYAAIHEFGFKGTEQVRSHTRLQTMIFGHPVTPFEVTVRAHSREMNMPERSYMRSGFEEKAPDGIEMLREAIKEAILT